MNFKKGITLFTLFCFVFSFILSDALHAAVAIKADTEKQLRRNLEEFVISPGFGRITGQKLFDTRQIVINIQDLHCHPGVQHNIANILAELDKKYGLKNVYVEGGYGDVDTSRLCDIEDKELKKDVIEGLIEQGKLTGGEYYSVTSNRPKVLKGLEDEALHKGNIIRLGKILDRKAAYEQKLKDLAKDLAFMKAKFLSQRNNKFNNIVERHKLHDIPSDKYYKLLEKYVQKINDNPDKFNNAFTISLSNYPNIKTYLEVSETGKQFDYKKISAELRDFMQSLKSAIPYSVYNSLVEKTENFNKLDELYIYLGQIAKTYNLNLKKSFPSLSNFFDYAETSRKINPISLVQEEKRLTEDIRIALCRDTSELDVSFLADFYSYFQDFLLNKLSADDYEYFNQKFEKFRSTWGRYVFKNGITELSEDFKLLNEFYRTNCQRNDCFLQNIVELKDSASRLSFPNASIGNPASGTKQDNLDTRLQNSGMTTDNHRSSTTMPDLLKNSELIVLVTGGFHSEGLKNLFSKQGVSYLVITPNVSKDSGLGEVYYTQLARYQANILSNSLALGLAVQQNSPSLFALSIEALNKQLKDAGIADKKHVQKILDEMEKSMGVKAKVDWNTHLITFDNGAQVKLEDTDSSALLHPFKPGEFVSPSVRASIETMFRVQELESAFAQALYGQVNQLFRAILRFCANNYLMTGDGLPQIFTEHPELLTREKVCGIQLETVARFNGYFAQAVAERQLALDSAKNQADWLKILMAIDLLGNLLFTLDLPAKKSETPSGDNYLKPVNARSSIPGKIWGVDELLEYFGDEKLPPIVTGATGFIGSNLAEHFAQTGKPAVILVRSRDNIQNLQRSLISKNIFITEVGDILEKDNLARLQKLASRTPFLYHLAAIVNSGANTLKEAQDIFLTNAFLTGLLAEVVQKSGGRMIYLSSTNIYDLFLPDNPNASIEPVTEDSPLFLSPQAEKLLSDGRTEFSRFINNYLNGNADQNPKDFVNDFLSAHGIPAMLEDPTQSAPLDIRYGSYAIAKVIPESFIPGISLRVTNVYGEGQEGKRVIQKSITGVLTGEPLEGSQDTRIFVHISDLIRALDQATEYLRRAPPSITEKGEMLLIGREQDRISLLDLLNMIRDAINPAAIIKRIDSKPRLMPPPISFKKAKQLLDWEARKPLNEAIRELIALRLDHNSPVDDKIEAAISGTAPSEIARGYLPGNGRLKDAAPGAETKENKIKQALEHLELTGTDEVHKRTVVQLLEFLKDHPRAGELTLMQFEGIAHWIVQEYSDNHNAYSNYKMSLDSAFLNVYPALRNKLSNIKNDRERLKASIILSGIANLFDPSHPEALKQIANDLNLPISGDFTGNNLTILVEEVYKKILNDKLIIGDADLEQFLSYLNLGRGGNVLYFLDNHGEMILDQLVIEELLNQGYTVSVVARKENVRDDVSQYEAENMLNINSALSPDLKSGDLRIITDGSYLLGPDLSQSSSQPEFLEAWNNSFCYIAKGAGSFRTLIGQKLSLAGLDVRMMKGSLSAYDQLDKLKGKKTYEKQTAYDLAAIFQPSAATLSLTDKPLHTTTRGFWNGIYGIGPLLAWLTTWGHETLHWVADGGRGTMDLKKGMYYAMNPSFFVMLFAPLASVAIGLGAMYVAYYLAVTTHSLIYVIVPIVLGFFPLADGFLNIISTDPNSDVRRALRGDIWGSFNSSTASNPDAGLAKERDEAQKEAELLMLLKQILSQAPKENVRTDDPARVSDAKLLVKKFRPAEKYLKLIGEGRNGVVLGTKNPLDIYKVKFSYPARKDTAQNKNAKPEEEFIGSLNDEEISKMINEKAGFKTAAKTTFIGEGRGKYRPIKTGQNAFVYEQQRGLDLETALNLIAERVPTDPRFAELLERLYANYIRSIVGLLKANLFVMEPRPSDFIVDENGNILLHDFDNLFSSYHFTETTVMKEFLYFFFWHNIYDLENGGGALYSGDDSPELIKAQTFIKVLNKFAFFKPLEEEIKSRRFQSVFNFYDLSRGHPLERSNNLQSWGAKYIEDFKTDGATNNYFESLAKGPWKKFCEEINVFAENELQQPLGEPSEKLNVNELLEKFAEKEKSMEDRMREILDAQELDQVKLAGLELSPFEKEFINNPEKHQGRFLSPFGRYELMKYVLNSDPGYKTLMDMRSVNNGLLAAPYAGIAATIKEQINPSNKELRGIVGGGGAAIDTLLYTNATEILSVDLGYPDSMNDLGKAENGKRTEKYLSTKYGIGYSISDENSFTYAHFFEALVAELKAIGVPAAEIERIAAKDQNYFEADPNNPGTYTMRFHWAYPGEKPKLRTVRFIKADITEPQGYPAILKEAVSLGVDFYMQKAGIEISTYYGNFINYIASGVKDSMILDNWALGGQLHQNEAEFTDPLPFISRKQGFSLAANNKETDFWKNFVLHWNMYGCDLKIYRKKAAIPSPGPANGTNLPASSSHETKDDIVIREVPPESGVPGALAGLNVRMMKGSLSAYDQLDKLKGKKTYEKQTPYNLAAIFQPSAATLSLTAKPLHTTTREFWHGIYGIGPLLAWFTTWGHETLHWAADRGRGTINYKDGSYSPSKPSARVLLAAPFGGLGLGLTGVVFTFVLTLGNIFGYSLWPQLPPYLTIPLFSIISFFSTIFFIDAYLNITSNDNRSDYNRYKRYRKGGLSALKGDYYTSTAGDPGHENRAIPENTLNIRGLIEEINFEAESDLKFWPEINSKLSQLAETAALDKQSTKKTLDLLSPYFRKNFVEIVSKKVPGKVHFKTDIGKEDILPIDEVCKLLNVPRSSLRTEISRTDDVCTIHLLEGDDVLLSARLESTNILALTGTSLSFNESSIHELSNSLSDSYDIPGTAGSHADTNRLLFNLNWYCAITNFEVNASLRNKGIGSVWYAKYLEPYIEKCGFKTAMISGPCTQYQNVLAYWQTMGFNSFYITNQSYGSSQTRMDYLVVKNLQPAAKAEKTREYTVPSKQTETTSWKNRFSREFLIPAASQSGLPDKKSAGASDKAIIEQFNLDQWDSIKNDLIDIEQRVFESKNEKKHTRKELEKQLWFEFNVTGSAAFLLKSEGKVVGYVIGGPLENYWFVPGAINDPNCLNGSKNSFYEDCLVVLPEFEGKRLAAQLEEKLFQKASDLHRDYLTAFREYDFAKKKGLTILFDDPDWNGLGHYAYTQTNVNSYFSQKAEIAEYTKGQWKTVEAEIMNIENTVPEEGLRHSAKDLEKQFDMPGSAVYLARYNNKIVGYVLGVPEKSDERIRQIKTIVNNITKMPPLEDPLFERSLVVLPEFGGKGIETLMEQELIKFALALDYKFVTTLRKQGAGLENFKDYKVRRTPVVERGMLGNETYEYFWVNVNVPGALDRKYDRAGSPSRALLLPKSLSQVLKWKLEGKDDLWIAYKVATSLEFKDALKFWSFYKEHNEPSGSRKAGAILQATLTYAPVIYGLVLAIVTLNPLLWPVYVLSFMGPIYGMIFHILWDIPEIKRINFEKLTNLQSPPSNKSPDGSSAQVDFINRLPGGGILVGTDVFSKEGAAIYPDQGRAIFLKDENGDGLGNSTILGTAVDEKGLIYVAVKKDTVRGDTVILKYDSTGKLLATFKIDKSSSGLKGNIVISKNLLYFIASGYPELREFNVETGATRKFEIPLTFRENISSWPIKLLINQQTGVIGIVEEHFASSIRLRFFDTTTETFEKEKILKGISSLGSITIDNAGYIYITDRVGSTIFVLSVRDGYLGYFNARDLVTCLNTDKDNNLIIGHFYHKFGIISHSDVLKILEESPKDDIVIREVPPESGVPDALAGLPNLKGKVADSQVNQPSLKRLALEDELKLYGKDHSLSPSDIAAEAPEFFAKLRDNRIVIFSPKDGKYYVWGSEQIAPLIARLHAENPNVMDENMSSIVTIDENGIPRWRLMEKIDFKKRLKEELFAGNIPGFLELLVMYPILKGAGLNVQVLDVVHYRTDRMRQYARLFFDKTWKDLQLQANERKAFLMFGMVRYIKAMPQILAATKEIVAKNGLIETLCNSRVKVIMYLDSEKSLFQSILRGNIEKPFPNEYAGDANITMPLKRVKAKNKDGSIKKDAAGNDVWEWAQLPNGEFWLYPELATYCLSWLIENNADMTDPAYVGLLHLANFANADLVNHVAAKKRDATGTLHLVDKTGYDLSGMKLNFGQLVEICKQDPALTELFTKKQYETKGGVAVVMLEPNQQKAIGVGDPGADQAMLMLDFNNKSFKIMKMKTEKGTGTESLYYAHRAVNDGVEVVMKDAARKHGVAILVGDHGSSDEADNPGHTGNDVLFTILDYRGNEVDPVTGERVPKKIKIHVPQGHVVCQADIAPTILQYMGIKQPQEMTGVSLAPEDVKGSPSTPVWFIILDGYADGKLDEKGQHKKDDLTYWARQRSYAPTLHKLYDPDGNGVVPEWFVHMHAAGHWAGLRGIGLYELQEAQHRTILDRKGMLGAVETLMKEGRIKKLKLTDYDQKKSRTYDNSDEWMRDLRRRPQLNDRLYAMGELKDGTLEIFHVDPIAKGATEINLSTMGTGRIITQIIVIIDRMIADGSFFNTLSMRLELLLAKLSGTAHFVTILQEINVHTSSRHLYNKVEYFKKHGVRRFMFDVASDGRDEPQGWAEKRIEELRDAMEYFGIPSEDYAINVIGREQFFDRGGNLNITSNGANNLLYGSLLKKVYDRAKKSLKGDPSETEASRSAALTRLEEPLNKPLTERIPMILRILPGLHIINTALKNPAEKISKTPVDELEDFRRARESKEAFNAFLARHKDPSMPYLYNLAATSVRKVGLALINFLMGIAESERAQDLIGLAGHRIYNFFAVLFGMELSTTGSDNGSKFSHTLSKYRPGNVVVYTAIFVINGNAIKIEKTLRKEQLESIGRLSEALEQIVLEADEAHLHKLANISDGLLADTNSDLFSYISGLSRVRIQAWLRERLNSDNNELQESGIQARKLRVLRVSADKMTSRETRDLILMSLKDPDLKVRQAALTMLKREFGSTASIDVTGPIVTGILKEWLEDKKISKEASFEKEVATYYEYAKIVTEKFAALPSVSQPMAFSEFRVIFNLYRANLKQLRVTFVDGSVLTADTVGASIADDLKLLKIKDTSYDILSIATVEYAKDQDHVFKTKNNNKYLRNINIQQVYHEDGKSTVAYKVVIKVVETPGPEGITYYLQIYADPSQGYQIKALDITGYTFFAVEAGADKEKAIEFLNTIKFNKYEKNTIGFTRAQVETAAQEARDRIGLETRSDKQGETTIGTFSPDQWEAIRNDIFEIGYNAFPKISREKMKARLETAFKIKDSVALLLWNKNKVVGFIVGGPIANYLGVVPGLEGDENIDKNNTFYEDCLSILPRFTRQGWGKTLEKEFLRELFSLPNIRYVTVIVKDGVAGKPGFQKVAHFDGWSGYKGTFNYWRAVLPSIKNPLLVLDVHGVLLQPTWKAEVRAAYRKLTGKEMSEEWLQENVLNKSDDEIALALTLAAGRPITDVPDVKEEMKEIRYAMRATEEPRAVPGALEFVKAAVSRHIPIIVISGSARDQIIHQLRAAGFLEYIDEKNVFHGVITDKVNRAGIINNFREKDRTIVIFDDLAKNFESVGDAVKIGLPQGDQGSDEYVNNLIDLCEAGADMVLRDFSEWQKWIFMLSKPAATVVHIIGSGDIDKNIDKYNSSLEIFNMWVTDKTAGDPVETFPFGFNVVINGQKVDTKFGMKDGALVFYLDLRNSNLSKEEYYKALVSGSAQISRFVGGNDSIKGNDQARKKILDIANTRSVRVVLKPVMVIDHTNNLLDAKGAYFESGISNVLILKPADVNNSRINNMVAKNTAFSVTMAENVCLKIVDNDILGALELQRLAKNSEVYVSWNELSKAAEDNKIKDLLAELKSRGILVHAIAENRDEGDSLRGRLAGLGFVETVSASDIKQVSLKNYAPPAEAPENEILEINLEGMTKEEVQYQLSKIDLSRKMMFRSNEVIEFVKSFRDIDDRTAFASFFTMLVSFGQKKIGSKEAAERLGYNQVGKNLPVPRDYASLKEIKRFLGSEDNLEEIKDLKLFTADRAEIIIEQGNDLKNAEFRTAFLRGIAAKMLIIAKLQEKDVYLANEYATGKYKINRIDEKALGEELLKLLENPEALADLGILDRIVSDYRLVKTIVNKKDMGLNANNYQFFLKAS
jgi:nucleoside-diphosphate-sugar epimerase/bisphosphoglycerate-independent phosphoglycerate mutase (AlkP superfamily)/uncharacterized protein with ATP-grasp and redox domains